MHIRDDPPRPGSAGHGDPLTEAAFHLEIADTLAGGVEAPQGGGNFRYTLRYDDECSAGSLEAASGLWLSIVSAHLMDLEEPPAAERA